MTPLLNALARLRTPHTRTLALLNLAALVLACAVALAACSGTARDAWQGAQLLARHGSGGGSPWSMFGKNSQRTGRSDHHGPSNSNLRWTYATPTNVRSETVFASDGTVCFGTDWNGARTSNFFALDPAGGRKMKKWGYTVNGRACNPVIAPDGTIYLNGHDTSGARETNLYALTTGGLLKWKKPLPPCFPRSLTLRSDGTLIMASAPGVGYDYNSVRAFDSNGNQLWMWTTTCSINDRLAFGYDGTIYVSLQADPQYHPGDISRLQALNATGAEKWSVSTEVNMGPRGPSVGSDGTVYFGTTYLGDGLDATPGKLWALNADGTVKWQHDLPGVAKYHPAIASDGTIIIGAGTLGGFQNLTNALCAVNPDGTRKWTYGYGSVNQPQTTPAIDADGNVYECFSYNGDSWLDVLSSAGNYKWTGNLQGGMVGWPHTIDIGEDGTIYIAVDYYLESNKYYFGLFAIGPGTP